ncbi:tetratricopeptide repeat protein [Klebsiella pneumoniae]|uniref:tetratricopeptide repeat protein n=1 Tax=Klebsiella pneumoniae TaxID=573 RepID=UPI000DA24751|nr:tetratricopeptide repeat protein [Klebsiella pneumoniae]PZB36813.1 tetratricopeptide repeat-containing protein [Klebsiella pneumoniae subsp. pneumoniae]PZB44872.1 tetratricopeptide repeat-containing protein [Klebsiella pneumoniae subsp. pneumoniae]PZB77305.1 tetratricopeptide repeat-containing protein [Klebsiella pneumoniae subsp. pneumoniae]
MKKSPSSAKKKLCFVIMGFGKKTDYKSGKTLNLDATYYEIIKPAAEECGIECIRADEVCHSGSIDREMYRKLLLADVVIADISTNNANALYELGVRHALKKGTTIIMSEKSGVLHFDLNHTATLIYEHLGDDIGCSEARKKRSELQKLISTALQESKTDSPIYTFLPDLKTPTFSEKEIEEIVEESNESEKEWVDVFNNAEKLLKEGNFTEAKKYYSQAIELRPNDDYLLQRLTLCTYKDVSDNISPVMACFDAMSILSALSPDTSNDPETTGLAGAISKNIWREIKDISFLDKAILLYERGYTIKKDYYNGENLAICHHEKMEYLKNLNATSANLNKEIAYHEVSAEMIFNSVLGITEEIINSNYFDERSDQKWVFASACQAANYIGDSDKSSTYFDRFKAFCDNSWYIETFCKNKLRKQ